MCGIAGAGGGGGCSKPGAPDADTKLSPDAVVTANPDMCTCATIGDANGVVDIVYVVDAG